MVESFRKCSSCKKDIPFESTYYRCSVSTCNRARANYAFCSIECWQAHSVTVNHRDAWGERETAPTRSAWLEQQEEGARSERAPERPSPTRRVIGTAKPEKEPPRDVLVVVSKLKAYIKDKSGMNTSDNVVPALSDHLRAVATQAIRNAAQDNRKTVLDRDVLKALSDRSRPHT